jgi:AraC family transcriptional regulator of adaptative response/methylated-DNA-[protein]-cysteine methyltransferase
MSTTTVMSNTPDLTLDDDRWRAFVERDPTSDGLFLVAVTTTKIFCRPTCPARRPRRENVRLYADADAARAAGFRPCRRCRPLDAPGAHPGWVRRVIDLADARAHVSARATDDDLLALGVEPRRARRYFLATFGQTFHAWQRARRVGAALERLREGDDLTRVALDAGFESLSGFRDAFARVTGAPPGRARAVSPLRCATIETPLGPLVLAAVDEGLCFAEFALPARIARQAARLARRLGRPLVPGTCPMIDRTRDQLAQYFAGERRAFDVPFVTAGTPFDEAVWALLRDLRYGETTTYDALARALGRPGAARAVGGAVGRNPISVLVPCHRVLRGDGTLSGYGGGLWRKERLLALERGVISPRSAP